QQVPIRIAQIGLLFIVYYAGVWIQQFFNLIIPSSVIGLVLMYILLTTNIIKVAWIKEGAGFLMKHLALFFIPATVGFLNYYDVFLGKGIWLFITTIISTVLVIVTAGRVSEFIARKRGSLDE